MLCREKKETKCCCAGLQLHSALEKCCLKVINKSPLHLYQNKQRDYERSQRDYNEILLIALAKTACFKRP
ncbi:hypothetical protein AOLI_G00245210 [Acnodon oligacanthus]